MSFYFVNNAQMGGMIKPAAYDRRGPLYYRKDAEHAVACSINVGDYFRRFAIMKSADLEAATTLLDEANDRFSRSLDRFVNLQREIAEASKKASSDIRKATDSLAQGLARLEKVTNFSQLERNVELLERAAKAIDMLAALHKVGTLEKIADALH